MTIGTGINESELEASLLEIRRAIEPATGSADQQPEPVEPPSHRSHPSIRDELDLLPQLARLRAQLRQELNLKSNDYRLRQQLEKADLRSCRGLKDMVERRLEQDARYVVLKHLDEAYCKAIRLGSGR
jgi:hypothetical protein